MELRLVRDSQNDELGATYGRILREDGSQICLTLEDRVREIEGAPVGSWKVHGETAIPRGRYLITFENSPKFGPRTLTVNKVPGFSGIRIHGGNKPEDTEGCIIVGDSISEDGLIHGASVHGILNAVKAEVAAAMENESVYLTIEGP